MKKLSIIRSKETNIACPYALPITDACNSMGRAILQLQAIEYIDDEAEKEKAKKRNYTLYLTKKIGERCIFADQIMANKNTVNCSFGDVAAGEGSSYLPNSPLYPRTFVGDGFSTPDANKQQVIYDPRLNYPEAIQRDIDVPFGLYSIFADKDNADNLIKLANASTNNLSNIRDRLNFLRDKYWDTLKTMMAPKSAVKLNNDHLKVMLGVINEWTTEG
jgi:hypothetical protein